MPRPNQTALELMARGLLVEVRAKRWSGLIGAPAPLPAALLSVSTLPGIVLIAPGVARSLDRIAKYAKRRLNAYSYWTPFGSFVPFSTFKDAAEMLGELRGQHLAVRSELVATRGGAIARADELAAEAWAAAGHSGKPMKQFADAFKTWLPEVVPTKEEIYGGTFFDVSYSVFPTLLFSGRGGDMLKVLPDSDEARGAIGFIDDLYASSLDDVCSSFLLAIASGFSERANKACSKIVRFNLLKRLNCDAVSLLERNARSLSAMNFFGNARIAGLLGTIAEEASKSHLDRDDAKLVGVCVEFLAYVNAHLSGGVVDGLWEDK